jgi:uncharacterized protein (TIGR02145 family)
MKKVSLLFFVFIYSSLLFAAYDAPDKTADLTIKSHNAFKEVAIGNQIWMAENLNVSTFRNGEPIPQAKTKEEWTNAGKNGQPAWCYYNFNSDNDKKYGKLYNWFAVIDPRGLAPAGWHVASDGEWTILTNYLGGAGKEGYINKGEELAGGKLKSSTGWGDIIGSNKSGFSALPGGYCNYIGLFDYVGTSGYWWSYTEEEPFSAWSRYMWLDFTVKRESTSKKFGLSVRCVRDLTKSKQEEKTKTYKIATIGNQVWMTENLNVSTFRNGDPIPEAKTKEEWQKAGEEKKPVWCYYRFDPENAKKVGGKFYNWYAVNDARGLAPAGWHIPSDAEWSILIKTLGGDQVAGLKIKNTSGWAENRNGTNESGFSALPGGFCNDKGICTMMGYTSHWWTKTAVYINKVAFFKSLRYDKNTLTTGSASMEHGYHVRCILGD